MQKLICITGPDGAGKSTLVKSLSKDLPSVHVANIWDIMDGGIATVPFSSKKDIDNYLCELTPDSRLLFLAHALKFSIDKALKFGKEIILINGYYYKYFATELVLGANETLVNSLIKTFPKPHLLLFLDLKPEAAVNRKAQLSRYECGLSKQPNKQNFIEFQKQSSTYWDTFDKTNWHIIDATKTPDELHQEVINLIKIV